MQEEHGLGKNECDGDIAAPAAAARARRAGKERITIRLDADVTAYFRERATGGGNYQSLINEALREHIQTYESVLEHTLRRVIHEELGSVRPRPSAAAGAMAADSSTASHLSPARLPAAPLRSRLPLLAHGLGLLLKRMR